MFTMAIFLTVVASSKLQSMFDCLSKYHLRWCQHQFTHINKSPWLNSCCFHQAPALIMMEIMRNFTFIGHTVAEMELIIQMPMSHCLLAFKLQRWLVTCSGASDIASHLKELQETIMMQILNFMRLHLIDGRENILWKVTCTSKFSGYDCLTKLYMSTIRLPKLGKLTLCP